MAVAGAGDFYRGEIAGQIAADMKANGGWITLDDLKNFPEPGVQSPLKSTYRGWDVYSLPPPTGGWVVLQALNILESAPAAELSGDSENRWIWLAEALRVCHGNRLQTPITDLVHYEPQALEKVDKAAARKLLSIIERPGSGETTHFSIVDGEGMGVGVTQSLNAYFGARAASAGLGFLYNDYMHEFEVGQPDHPFNLRPGAMPYSSMSSTILSRDGEVELVVGSPGSKRIISAVVQVVSHWIDVGKGIEAAVRAPRLHVVPDDQLFLEARQTQVPASLLLQLELRGYNIVRPLSSLFRENLNPYFGGVHAVARENGRWHGAADPRRDGRVGTAWR